MKTTYLARAKDDFLTFYKPNAYYSIMEISEEERAKVEKQLADTMLVALEKGTITQEDTQEISQFVLMFLDEIQTQEQLEIFFQTAAKKWPIFKHIADIESGEKKSEHDKEIAHQVEALSHEGKVEEALALAKSAAE